MDVQERQAQAVLFPAGAWVFPAGNFEDLTGNFTLNPRAMIVFWNWQEMIQLEHIIPAAERNFLYQEQGFRQPEENPEAGR